MTGTLPGLSLERSVDPLPSAPLVALMVDPPTLITTGALATGLPAAVTVQPMVTGSPDVGLVSDALTVIAEAACTVRPREPVAGACSESPAYAAVIVFLPPGSPDRLSLACPDALVTGLLVVLPAYFTVATAPATGLPPEVTVIDTTAGVPGAIVVAEVPTATLVSAATVTMADPDDPAWVASPA